MSNFGREMLSEIVQEWTQEQIDEYLAQLRDRREQLDTWIRYVQTIRKKKRSKSTPENGPRDGR
jgi:hypothetical protein